MHSDLNYEKIAMYYYEHNDGDQRWNDYTTYYKKDDGTYVKEDYEGYYGNESTSEVSFDDITKDLEKVRQEVEKRNELREKDGCDEYCVRSGYSILIDLI